MNLVMALARMRGAFSCIKLWMSTFNVGDPSQGACNKIVAFESAITNLRDIIPFISAVTILRWDANTDSANLTKDQIQRMRVQRQKAVRNLSLNPTVDNSWDKIKYNFWKDRVTNIYLGAAQATFQTHEDITNLKFLFSASDKSNTAVQRGDQRKSNLHSCMITLQSCLLRLDGL